MKENVKSLVQSLEPAIFTGEGEEAFHYQPASKPLSNSEFQLTWPSCNLEVALNFYERVN